MTTDVKICSVSKGRLVTQDSMIYGRTANEFISMK